MDSEIIEPCVILDSSETKVQLSISVKIWLCLYSFIKEQIVLERAETVQNRGKA